MKIVLLGYMGSGKSTLGKLLAKDLNLSFTDLDDYIVENEKMSISEIFKNKGEIYFRTIENTYLQKFLLEKDKYVLALGGGTPCYANNMEFIKNKGIKSFYLKASISTLIDRLLSAKQNRPLVANLENEKLPEFVAKHLFERRFYYEQADFTIQVDGNITAIIKKIKKTLH